MVRTFQEDPDSSPVLLLSLKAGGVGLNLTAATHVFHFDRWWNPAVEDQATDRTYRIGQTKNVQVHKLVTIGTLEEKIDALLESKRDLADRVVGTGEGWLTELDDDALRRLVALDPDAELLDPDEGNGDEPAPKSGAKIGRRKPKEVAS
jgi:SNF2 family DNA or RNA helicase